MHSSSPSAAHVLQGELSHLRQKLQAAEARARDAESKLAAHAAAAAAPAQKGGAADAQNLTDIDERLATVEASIQTAISEVRPGALFHSHLSLLCHDESATPQTVGATVTSEG